MTEHCGTDHTLRCDCPRCLGEVECDCHNCEFIRGLWTESRTAR